MPPTPLRVAVVSLGCPKALVDSEKMLALLAQAGCLVGAEEDQADVILINTCAFIAPAEAESMRAIRRAVALKRTAGVRRVVVAGCLPQRRRQELFKTAPGIDALVGVHDRGDIVRAVTGRQTGLACLSGGRGTGVWPVGAAGAPLDDRARLRLTPRHLAYIRLAEGCSQACSYCTIPSIRGPLKSKPMTMVLEEAAELVADGAVELVLIAQDTTAYGRELADRTNLPDLLGKLDALPGVGWIRLLYAHPATLDEAVIEALAGCPRVVKYLDLPLQHVSDKILGLMRRPYDRASVERLLERLRRRIPGIALRTGFIVGFPGEGQAEFDELAGFVRSEAFAALGVFTYWPEEGTPAARLAGHIPARVKNRRRDKLMRLQQEIAFAANAARVGRTLDVLVDGVDAAGRCVGRHAAQAPEIDGLCRLTYALPAGRLVPCRVVAADGYDLLVEPLVVRP